MKFFFASLKGFYRYALIALILLIHVDVWSANRYWVAAINGNWNNSSNWSFNPGGAGGASVPGASDVAIFNNSSSANCSITANITVQGIQITGYTGIISQASGITITITTGGFSQSSGTFTGNDAAIDINGGTFSLSGGTFTSTTAILSVGGNFNSNTNLFTITSGSFLSNNGTVQLDPDFTSCGQFSATITLTPAITFNNLTLDATDFSCTQDVIQFSGTTPTVSGTLTHFDGFFNNGTINVTGNFALQTGADGGTGIINISGTGAQEYSNTGSGRTSVLQVNKASGAFTPAIGTTTIRCQVFNLLSGSMTAPSGNFHIGGSHTGNPTLLTYSGGTFTAAGGAVVVDPIFGSCGQFTASVSLSSVLTFYDFKVQVDDQSCTEDILSLNNSSNLVVTNNFTHTDGFINSGTIQVQGNFTLETGADGGNATILVNGITDQYYTNTSTSRMSHLRVNKSGGSVFPNPGTTSLLVQQFTLEAGTFQAPSGTFSVGGNWSGSNPTLFSYTGGTFDANSGTVSVDPVFTDCAQRTGTLSASSSLTFYNLNVQVDDVSCTEDILAVSGTIIVANDFTHTDGFINTGTIEVRKNIILLTGADGGTATILLNGTTDQTYANSSTARFAHLSINKSSGLVSPAVGTTTFLVQRFTLTNGTFQAPTGTFSIGGNWSGSNPTLMTISGGTFDPNLGAVKFDPTFTDCAQRTATLSSTTPVNFYDLIIQVDDVSCTEDIFLVSGASTVIVQNDFTHIDGFINTGTIQVYGDVFLQTGADGGDGTILLNGTTDQTFNNTSTSRFAHLRVNKTTGVVNPGVGTTDFLVQQFTLDAGTFNAPTGTMSIGGNWSGTNPTLFTITSGTFQANTGTVKFDPTFTDCAQRTATLSSPSPVTFYNLTIQVDDVSCTEDIFLVSGASTVIVENDFTHIDGFINTGTIQLQGDIYLQTGADGGNATILLNGTTDQTYNNTSSARFAHLSINKSSGIVSPGVGTTGFLVQQFTLTAGSFTAPSGNFNIGGSWSGTNPTLFTYSGGTFDAGTGTVVFDATFTDCTQRTATLSSSTTISFYNLNINIDDVSCVEDIFLVSGASTVIVNNDFTHTDGFINTGTIQVKRDVYLQSGADGGNATILLNGTGDQSYYNSSTARFAHLQVNKASGNVLPGGATTTFLVQRFTLEGGNFTAPSGTFFIGGNWAGTDPVLINYTGGSFIANSGTVKLDPTFTDCAQRSGSLLATLPLTFYDLIIEANDVSCVEDNLNISSSATVIVANDFTHTDGFINTGTLQVQGDIFLQSGADGGTATILLNGTTDQTYNNSSTARFAHVQVNKTSGNVLPGAGTTTFLMQRFTLTAGTFTAPTGDLNIGGSLSGNQTLFTYSGGTFVPSTGTVVLNPQFTDCAQRTATMNLTAALTLNNLTINVDDVSCSEDILNVTGTSTTISVAGDLLLTDGFFNGGTLSAAGHVTVTSTFDGGTGALTFSGSTDQNFTLTGATGNFNGDIVINKTTGNVILQSVLQLDAASQDLTFTNGLLNTTSVNLLIIGDNVTTPGGSATSYVNGPMRKIGNDGYTFPTGKSGIFSPIRIGAPAVTTDAFDAEYFVADPNGAGYTTTLRETSLKDVSTCDYWILNRTTGTSNVQVGLTWNRATGCYGFTNTFFLAVARWDGSQWRNAGMTYTTDNGTTGTVNSPTVSSFSPFAIGSQAYPLPVVLKSFNYEWLGKSLELKWAVSSEINNAYFTIERSADGKTFTVLDSIPSKWTGLETLYNLADPTPLSGISYYRLSQTDLDGSHQKLATIAVSNSASTDELNIYPNPVQGKTFFINKNTHITITDLLNRIVFSGNVSQSVDVSEFPSGVYLVTTAEGKQIKLVIP